MAALLLLLASSLAPAPRALADGDPASDVLLAQNAFYPYNLPEDYALEASMNRVLSAAAHAGLPLSHLAIDSRHGPYGLVQSAMLAVVALAHASGHSISPPQQTGHAPRSSGPPVIVLLAIPTALVLIGGAISARRRRPRRP